MVTEHFQKARRIFCYASLPGEVDTFYLMKEVLVADKILALPKVHGQCMIFYRVDDLDSLQRGYMGIREPSDSAEVVSPGQGDLMIMPGLAFDRQKHRIGYGGGFYDKYLERYPEGFTAAFALDFQILDELEYEDTDIRPDQIILPNEIIE